MRHPLWCDQQACAERGEHRSPEVMANAQASGEVAWFVADKSTRGRTERDEHVIVRARLAKFAMPGREEIPAWVDVFAYSDPAHAEDVAVMLTVRQASMLSAGLDYLASIAGGDAR